MTVQGRPDTAQMSAATRYRPFGLRLAQRVASDSFDFFIALFSRRTTLKLTSLQFDTAVEK